MTTTAAQLIDQVQQSRGLILHEFTTERLRAREQLSDDDARALKDALLGCQRVLQITMSGQVFATNQAIATFVGFLRECSGLEVIRWRYPDHIFGSRRVGLGLWGIEIDAAETVLQALCENTNRHDVYEMDITLPMALSSLGVLCRRFAPTLETLRIEGVDSSFFQRKKLDSFYLESIVMPRLRSLSLMGTAGMLCSVFLPDLRAAPLQELKISYADRREHVTLDLTSIFEPLRGICGACSSLRRLELILLEGGARGELDLSGILPGETSALEELSVRGIHRLSLSKPRPLAKTSIKKLCLRDGYLDSCQGLCLFPHLETLDVVGLSLAPVIFSHRGMVCGHVSLQSICLDVTCEDLERLVHAMRHQTHAICSLDLHLRRTKSGRGHPSASSYLHFPVLKELVGFKCIKRLTLRTSGRGVTTATAAALAQGLAMNRTLEHLGVQGSGEHADHHSILEALCGHPSLRSLLLIAFVPALGSARVLERLIGNPTLGHLRWDTREVPEDSFNAIYDGFIGRKGAFALEFSNCSLPLDALPRLGTLLESDTSNSTKILSVSLPTSYLFNGHSQFLELSPNLKASKARVRIDLPIIVEDDNLAACILDVVSSNGLVASINHVTFVRRLLATETAVKHYLKLNSSGCCLLTTCPGPPPGVWPVLLERITNEPSVLLHFLRTKPDLVQPPSTLVNR